MNHYEYRKPYSCSLFNAHGSPCRNNCDFLVQSKNNGSWMSTIVSRKHMRNGLTFGSRHCLTFDAKRCSSMFKQTRKRLFFVQRYTTFDAHNCLSTNVKQYHGLIWLYLNLFGFFRIVFNSAFLFLFSGSKCVGLSSSFLRSKWIWHKKYTVSVGFTNFLYY